MRNRVSLISIVLFLVMEVFILSAFVMRLPPIFVLISFSVYIFGVFLLDSSFITTYFYILFYLAQNLLGITLIESRVIYLDELAQISFNVGAIYLIAIVHVVFVEILFLKFTNAKTAGFFYPRISVKQENTKKLCMQMIIVVQLIITCIAIVRIIRYPALLLGIDRFIYNKQYLPGLWGSISVILTLFIPIDAMYFKKYKSKLPVLAMISYYIYLLWIGTKFGMFLISSYWIIVPYAYSLKRRQFIKVIKYFVMLLVLLLGLVTLQGKLIYNRTAHESADYLWRRTAQQGQMWWAIYKDYKGQKHYGELKDEERTFFTDQEPKDKEFGIYKMMKKVMPASTFYNKVYVGNTRYAFSTQASIYYYFGFFGLLSWTIITAIAYSTVFKYYIRAFLNEQFISVIVLTRLFLTMNNVLIQSDFNKLFSWQTLVSIITLIFLRFFKIEVENNGIRNCRNWM